jgi:hypothetical protein
LSAPQTILLNLGCGVKTSPRPEVINLDWTIYLRLKRNPLLRWLEKTLLGDARQRGETHQRMDNRINLGALLTSLGYRDLCRQRYDTSLVPDWNAFGLDLNEQGQEYKPGSFYLEARK